MIQRRAEAAVKLALNRQAAVALLGPRQVGKTTLALDVASTTPSLYLDLESPPERAKLADPELFLRNFVEQLVVLDEIHRVPEVFASLRGLIDLGRREGRRTNRFLILGSASIDLLKQSSESLAGRIEYVHLHPVDVLEVEDVADPNVLWVRGGFPDSLLAESDADSYAYRDSFIRTYLERDVSQFAPRVPAETLGRMWTMLAHSQGSLLNASQLAASIGIGATTVTRYVDLLVDLMLVRRLLPFHANVRKRLAKSPRIYIRDSGLVHALLGIRNFNALIGHPVAGPSWEGFVIENLLSAAPTGTTSSFYRTSAGAEIDLILDLPDGGGRWAIEVKRSLTPRVERGFHLARAVGADRAFVVNAGTDTFPLSDGVDAIGVFELANVLARA